MESYDFRDLGRILYADALNIQTDAFDRSLDAKAHGGLCHDILFFCEHDPVLTIGKSGKDSNLLVSEGVLRSRELSFYHTNRGGDITYHGPGQITGYPVFDIESRGLGLKRYIYLLEEIMINFLSLYGLKGERLEGATGVWIEPAVPGRARKICAIGVKSSRFVTMHGFALNINTDLTYYSYINPCGFTDKGVTSLAMELGDMQDFDRAKQQLRTLFSETF